MHIQSPKRKIMVSKYLLSIQTKSLSLLLLLILLSTIFNNFYVFLDVKCPSCNNIYVIEIQQSSKCTKSPPTSSILAGINIVEKKVEASGSGGEGTSGLNKTSHSFSSIGKYSNS